MADDVGQFRVHADYPGNGETLLYIERADERVLVSDRLLEDIRAGRGHPNVSLGDGVLTIKARNRTVSYGLVERDVYSKRWLAVKLPEITQEPHD